MARFRYTTSPRSPSSTGLWALSCEFVFDDDLETERGLRRALRSDLVRSVRPGDKIITPSVWMFFGADGKAEEILKKIIVERRASIKFVENGLTLGPCSEEDFPRSFEKIRRETEPFALSPEVASRVRAFCAKRTQLSLRGTLR